MLISLYCSFLAKYFTFHGIIYENGPLNAMATVSESLVLAIQAHQSGRLQAAEQIYRQILQVEPNHADAIHLLGVVASQTGRPDEAAACCRRALQLKPDYVEAHNNLGNALKDQGKLDEAAACFRRAVELKPDFAMAHSNLGNALRALGRPAEAVVAYRRAVELQPDFAMAHNNLGVALKEQGNLDEAVACCRRALQLKPDYTVAHNNLGNALRAQRKLDEAVACYRRAVELKPDYTGAHYNLGNTLRAQWKLDEAIASYRRALELRPDYAEAHNNLGSALKEQGKLDEAIQCHRRAAACCQRVLQTAPRSAAVQNSLGKSFAQLAMIVRGRLPEDDLIAMRQLLSEANVHGDSRIALEFGLARVLDARGNYDEAAEHLREANALRSADVHTLNQEQESANHRSLVDSLIATSTPQFFARMNGFGLETELPVFIFGLHRSGTTLTEHILASHSQVFGAGELPYCGEMLQFLPQAMLRSDTPLECLRDIDRQTARDLAQRHVDRLQALAPGALRIVDKNPDNYHYLGLISVLFPRARLIHCRRDLRDVALSSWMTDFTPAGWASHPDHIALRFEEYRRLMDHWQEVLPVPFLNVDYEELVEYLEGVARRIVAWCGLEWEPGCLKFHETRRSVRTPSATEVRQPIYKTSVGHWKNYEKSLGELFSKVERLNFRQAPADESE